MPKREIKNALYYITYGIDTDVMKYDQFVCSKRKDFIKKFYKTMAWKLVPGPFSFLKNPLYKAIRGNLHADFDIF